MNSIIICARVLHHTAAKSLWQNGVCECNHALADRCIEKIIKNDQKHYFI